jgi:micrococcal nuclease
VWVNSPPQVRILPTPPLKWCFMKKVLAFLFAFVMMLPSPLLAYSWKVVRVVDGDTVKFEVNFLPKELGKLISVRVSGIDTPEKGKRAKCPKEAALAQKATEFTKSAIARAKKIDVKLLSWDKYGGRVLGYIMIDGVNLGHLLITADLAKPYQGGKKESWCD